MDVLKSIAHLVAGKWLSFLYIKDKVNLFWKLIINLQEILKIKKIEKYKKKNFIPKPN